MLVMRFEMDPGDGELWKLPESSTRDMATAIPFPVRDMSVDVSEVEERLGWEMVVRDIRFGGEDRYRCCCGGVKKE